MLYLRKARPHQIEWIFREWGGGGCISDPKKINCRFIADSLQIKLEIVLMSFQNNLICILPKRSRGGGGGLRLFRESPEYHPFWWGQLFTPYLQFICTVTVLVFGALISLFLATHDIFLLFISLLSLKRHKFLSLQLFPAWKIWHSEATPLASYLEVCWDFLQKRKRKMHFLWRPVTYFEYWSLLRTTPCLPTLIFPKASSSFSPLSSS